MPDKHQFIEGLDDYQALASRTSRRGQEADDLERAMGTLISALGLAGEAGEAAEYFKKVYGHGHPEDKERLIKELGDVLWYVADLAYRHGIPLSRVAAININKLLTRYPDKFSREDSLARRDEAGE